MQAKKKHPQNKPKPCKTKRIFVEKIHVNIYIYIYKDENIIQLGL